MGVIAKIRATVGVLALLVVGGLAYTVYAAASKCPDCRVIHVEARSGLAMMVTFTATGARQANSEIVDDLWDREFIRKVIVAPGETVIINLVATPTADFHLKRWVSCMIIDRKPLPNHPIRVETPAGDVPRPVTCHHVAVG